MIGDSVEQVSVAESLKGAKCLFVASTGGHLAQLVRISSVIEPHPESVWVTFESDQSLSLLEGKNRLFVPYVKPRDLKGILVASSKIKKLWPQDFEAVVSTGAALALAALPQSKKHVDRSIYIESVSRLSGPSLSGKIAAKFPHIETYTQHRSWADNRWTHTSGVLEAFEAVEHISDAKLSELKIFVSLGTIQGYRFDRMVDALLATGLCGEHTVWQLGESSRDDLPGKVLDYMSASDFEQYSKDADLVITHSGVGTILQLLEWGIFPVVVPRSAKYKEHVDDHQFQIADYLKSGGLGLVLTPDEISAEKVQSALISKICNLSGSQS